MSNAEENDPGLVTRIMRFEQGEAGALETLELFEALIEGGLVGSLQGSYGRSAHHLIESGFLAADGTITDMGREYALDLDEEN